MKQIKLRVRIVIIKNNKLLVTYDSRDDYYFYVGGKVEYGETLKKAWEREIKEELGDVKFNFEKFSIFETLLRKLRMNIVLRFSY